MANAFRLGDITQGHPKHGAIELTTCFGNVMGNGRPIAIKGDICRDGGDHGSPSIQTCSSSVSINGKGTARTGDRLTCGDTLGQGSPDILIGG